jgi:hypothetical protein
VSPCSTCDRAEVGGRDVLGADDAAAEPVGVLHVTNEVRRGGCVRDVSGPDEREPATAVPRDVHRDV